MEDLRFIAFGYLVKKIVQALKKVLQIIIEWGNSNIIIYNIAKLEAAIFSKSHL